MSWKEKHFQKITLTSWNTARPADSKAHIDTCKNKRKWSEELPPPLHSRKLVTTCRQNWIKAAFFVLIQFSGCISPDAFLPIHFSWNVLRLVVGRWVSLSLTINAPLLTSPPPPRPRLCPQDDTGAHPRYHGDLQVICSLHWVWGARWQPGHWHR